MGTRFQKLIILSATLGLFALSACRLQKSRTDSPDQDETPLQGPDDGPSGGEKPDENGNGYPGVDPGDWNDYKLPKPHGGNAQNGRGPLKLRCLSVDDEAGARVIMVYDGGSLVDVDFFVEAPHARDRKKIHFVIAGQRQGRKAYIADPETYRVDFSPLPFQPDPDPNNPYDSFVVQPHERDDGGTRYWGVLIDKLTKLPVKENGFNCEAVVPLSGRQNGNPRDSKQQPEVGGNVNDDVENGGYENGGAVGSDDEGDAGSWNGSAVTGQASAPMPVTSRPVGSAPNRSVSQP